MMEGVILEFNIKELLALFGLAQSVYVLVYMGFRSGRISRAILPNIFFFILSLAFLFSAAKGQWHDILPYYGGVEWFLWVSSIPLSALLALQIARITEVPPAKYWGVLLFLPLGCLSVSYLSGVYGEQAEWQHVVGIILGAVSLLVLWGRRDWLDDVTKHKNGKERFWIIISLIVLNIGMILNSLLNLNGAVTVADSELIRVIIGISFVYIVSTSLFRIYPHAVFIAPKKAKAEGSLSEAEIKLALKIEDLINRDKIYQEPSYGRSDMARELSITESNLSKIVNFYFDKSVPQLLNGLRVQEAKALLKQTDADITVISGESGFNSIATFNRVFKEIEGVSPSEYREKSTR